MNKSNKQDIWEKKNRKKPVNSPLVNFVVFFICFFVFNKIQGHYNSDFYIPFLDVSRNYIHNKIDQGIPPTTEQKKLIPEKKYINFISKYEIRSHRLCLCPFEVYSNSDKDTVLVFEEVLSTEIPAVVYVRAGDTVGLRVPPGEYEIKMITGTDWRGDVALFGPNTLYTRGDKTLDFVEMNGGCSGNNLILRQVNGNFHQIPTQSFGLY